MQGWYWWQLNGLQAVSFYSSLKVSDLWTGQSRKTIRRWDASKKNEESLHCKWKRN